MHLYQGVSGPRIFMLCESVPILVFLHMEDAVELQYMDLCSGTIQGGQLKYKLQLVCIDTYVLQHNVIYNVPLLKYGYNMHSS